jgi:hypothetical protein
MPWRRKGHDRSNYVRYPQAFPAFPLNFKMLILDAASRSSPINGTIMSSAKMLKSSFG